MSERPRLTGSTPGGAVARRTVLRLPAAGLLATAGVAVLAGAASCSEDDGVNDESPPPAAARRIDYGQDSSQYVELSLPDATPRGVVVVIHGGFWRSAYELSLSRPLVQSLVAQGWAALNIEYRRVGNGGGVPETLDDVRAAIGVLVEQGVNATTLVTLGHSAGGHLATWAGGRVDGVTHVISQAGVLDLVAASNDNLGGGATQAFLGHAAGPADVDVDPMQQIPLAVPVWCVHGVGDDIVPISQSQDYVAAATAAGAKAEMVEVDGDHFVVIDPDSQAWREILDILDAIA